MAIYRKLGNLGKKYKKKMIKTLEWMMKGNNCFNDKGQNNNFPSSEGENITEEEDVTSDSSIVCLFCTIALNSVDKIIHHMMVSMAGSGPFLSC